MARTRRKGRVGRASEKLCSDCGIALQESGEGYLECPECKGKTVFNYLAITPEKLAEVTAEKARSGDTEAAFTILQSFVSSVDHHDERSWRDPANFIHARYIADAFEKLIRAHMSDPKFKGKKWDDWETGEREIDANVALGLKSRRPGRRKGADEFNNDALAAAYNLLLINGFTPKQAKWEIRRKIGASEDTLARANAENDVYQIYGRVALDPNATADERDHATEIIKSSLNELDAGYTALIAEIIAGRNLTR